MITEGTSKKESEHHKPASHKPKSVKLWKLIVKDYIFILTGVFAAGFGLKGFLLPNGFIDGGAVGISLLIASKTSIDLSWLLILVNIPFIFLSLKVMGGRFTFTTAVSIVLLAIVVHSVPYPEVTDDDLLVAFFGGFFLGLGIGMAIRGGGVLDGTEVLAIHLSRKTSLTIGDIIILVNVFIFLIAAWLLSVEVALYSILTYLVAAKTVDYVIRGVEEYTGVTIITPHVEKIREMITKKMGRGVTIYKGESGWVEEGKEPKEIKIIYTVITRLEVSKLNAEISLIDADAFVITTSIRDTKGGMIKRNVIH